MGYVLSGMFSTAQETGDYQEVAVNSFSSPIALYFVIDSFKEYGPIAIIRLIGEFSFSLAIINILPIPALDGGRILLLIIEFIRRKPMNRKVENAIIAISFYALMLLMLAVVLKDIIFINVIKDMF
jgi:regulator of sigma E protease